MPKREEYQKNKEHYRKYNREYLRLWRLTSTSDYSEYQREYFRKYRSIPEQKLRNNARNAVNNAITQGKLQRQQCETDSCVVVGEAHHDDYTKPLDIKWLCRKHHEELHHPNINT